MPKVRCFQPPGAPVRIVVPNERLRNPGESDDAFCARIAADAVAKDPTLAGLPFVDVPKTVVDGLPRALRHKWRVVGATVAMSPGAPDLPHPKQTLIDEIANASTIDALKIAVRKLIS